MSPRAAIESMVSSPAWPRGQGFRMRRRIMVGSMRWTGTVLACLSFFAAWDVAGRESPSSHDGPGQEPAAVAAGADKDKPASRTDKPAVAADAKLDVGAFFRQPG